MPQLPGDETYISVDVETSDPTPCDYSLLSIGAYRDQQKDGGLGGTYRDQQKDGGLGGTCRDQRSQLQKDGGLGGTCRDQQEDGG